jgi:hypothetical protein
MTGPDEQIPGWAIELIRQVERLNEKIPSHVEWATRNILDHEKRIRDLEQFKWRMTGVASVSSALVALIIEVLARTVFK